MAIVEWSTPFAIARLSVSWNCVVRRPCRKGAFRLTLAPKLADERVGGACP